MKKTVFKLTAILMGICFSLIFMEIFLRVNPKLGYIYNSAKFKRNSVILKMLDGRAYRTSALLGYESVPNRQGWSNSYGLRGTKEYKLKKSNGIYRILILGDSVAEAGVSAEFLEDLLNNNSFLKSKYKFEIWNAGVGGYDVRRYYLYLKHKGLNYKPDMVILFLFMNDFNLTMNIYYKEPSGATAYFFSIPEVLKRYNVSPFLMKHSYLYRFIILKLNNYLLNRKKTEDANQLEEDGRYYLEMIKEICESRKIPLIAAIFPYLKPLSEYIPYQTGEYKIVNKVVKDLKIDYLNLYDLLAGEDLFNLRDKQDDEIHPSGNGQRLIARIIYDYILDNHFVTN